MERGELGRRERAAAGNERFEAFIPAPLPPDPPIQLSGETPRILEKALVALGRLDSIADSAMALFHIPYLFIHPYIRKEATLSSRIEGTQSSISELYLFELEAQRNPVDDVIETVNYATALERGLERMRELPLCNRLIRELHAILLKSARGQNKRPGEFRRSYVRIGGTRFGNAVYVPPPHTEVDGCMANLEKFLHAEDDGLPALVRAGIAHLQFETIHPFLDGNGRIGRLLILLILMDAGLLRKPVLHLSEYFERHRDEYFRLLNATRLTGDWETWIAFFLEGVQVVAEGAEDACRRLLELFETDRKAIGSSVGRRAGSVSRVHDAFCEAPIMSIKSAAERAELSYGAASSAMEALQQMDIVREITGRRRGKAFSYQKYMDILNEGMEPRQED